MLPDAESVATFVNIAESGSFRASARALGVSKSTISARIAALEAKLGVRLLERTTRSVRLSEAGFLFRRHVAPAVDALRAGVAAVKGVSGKAQGRLRVSAPLEFDEPLLSQLVSAYLRRCPEVTLEIELSDCRVDLVADQLDVALQEGPSEDGSLIAHAIGKPRRLVTIASLHYLSTHGAPETPNELSEHACLVMAGHREPTRWHFQHKHEASVVNVRPRAVVNRFETLCSLAADGHGVARVPERCFADHPRRKRLRTILDDFAPPARALHALYQTPLSSTPKLIAFLELLDQLLGQKR